MKSATRSPNLEIWAICPLLVDKTAFAATGRPRSLRLHRLETCFGKPVRPPPSAKTTEASAREAVAEALAVTRKIVSGSPAGQPPAARERRRRFAMAVAEASAVARKIFSGSPRASSQRQNYGSERERFNRRRESFLGKPDGPDPSVKTTGTSFRAARRARPKPKPSMILRVTKNGTRRARAGFLRTLNPKRLEMWVVKGWGCRFRRAPPRPPGSRARCILETLNPKP